MVHTRVLDKYIHFSLMYTTDHIFPDVPIKQLVNQDGEATAPQQLVTGTKPSVSKTRVLSRPCVVKKATAYDDTEVLNM